MLEAVGDVVVQVGIGAPAVQPDPALTLWPGQIGLINRVRQAVPDSVATMVHPLARQVDP